MYEGPRMNDSALGLLLKLQVRNESPKLSKKSVAFACPAMCHILI